MSNQQPSIALADVRYKQCQLTPTEDKMKPVVILNYPFSPDLANRMGASWMFDGLGNAVSFAGAIKLSLEYAGARIHLVGPSSKLELLSQKIVSIHVQHGDGEEENDLYGSMRVHLPNVDMEDQKAMGNLFDTLKFLVRLNKAAFAVQIDPAQGSLFPDAQAEPGAPVQSPEKYRMDFKAKVSGKDGIVGYLELVPVQGGYSCGWEVRCPGLKGEPAAGLAIKADSEVFEKRDAAIVWGCSEVLEWINRGLDPASAAEKKAVETIRAWCFAQAPGLNKEAKKKSA